MGGVGVWGVGVGVGVGGRVGGVGGGCFVRTGNEGGTHIGGVDGGRSTLVVATAVSGLGHGGAQLGEALVHACNKHGGILGGSPGCSGGRRRVRSKPLRNRLHDAGELLFRCASLQRPRVQRSPPAVSSAPSPVCLPEHARKPWPW